MDSIIRNQATAPQIRALEDATQNPLTGADRPPGYNAMLQGRRRLPVHQCYQEILFAYHQSQVMILSSETGSGKSTQVPQLLLCDEYASGLEIACTQPRRLATRELASRVAREVGVALGEEVGYKIRGEERYKNKKTRLVYLTEGVLVQQLAADRDLKAYSCVILDDAHERSLNMDLSMALLKKIVSRRKDFKVVIMSATLDTELFQGYFNNCPAVHIPGRTFQVQTSYIDAPTPNVVVAAAALVANIHKNDEPGDILVFMPGEDEIRKVCELVRKYTQNLQVFPLFGNLAGHRQSKAVNSSSSGRRCIVSTNIAETSLTIDGVVYVIDSGLSRQMIFNPRLRMNMLEPRQISQASAEQRAGRAGRTRNGYCYRLYTKEDFNLMNPATEPAVRCDALDGLVLRLVSAGHRNMVDFDWIDPPHPETLLRALQDLNDWGFLKADGTLDGSGRVAARCPIEPKWYRAIETGATLGCAIEIADIALLCSSQKPLFMRPAGYLRVADMARKTFAHPFSDHLTLLNAFNAYMHLRRTLEQNPDTGVNLRDWCLKNFLNIEALEQVRVARPILGFFLQYRAKVKPCCVSISDTTTIRKALAIGLFTHTAIWHTGDQYRTVHENTSALLSPQSSLLGAGIEWVVYSGFQSSGGKSYLHQATAINAEWIADLPFFQDERLPRTFEGFSFRQGNVKKSLDEARSRIAASNQSSQ